MAPKTTLNAKNLESLGAERLAQLLIEISTGNAAAKRKLRLALAGAATFRLFPAGMMRDCAPNFRSEPLMGNPLVPRVDWCYDIRPMTQKPTIKQARLRRVVTLPMLVLYGVGVTVGAGIFVLIGKVGEIAGPRAPLAFLLAAVVATATAFSYAALARDFPHAAGASLYVHRAFGRFAGLAIGLGVSLTGIVSSATITLGFTGYLLQLVELPRPAVIVAALAFTGWLVARGVRESVGVAAAMTAIELGELGVLIAAGAPVLADADVWVAAFGFAGPLDPAAIVAAAVLAFFAFIGFEDIVNMAEETVEPDRVVARAILYTLGITTLLYMLVALVAAGAPPAVGSSVGDAPLAALWTRLAGTSGAWLSTLALVAVLNGVIVQVIMASRLLYGMAREHMLPAFLARVGKRQTPVTAVWIVVGLIVMLALAFPIATLARLTTTVTLLVFTSVNVALVVLAGRPAHDALRPWRPVGVVGAALTGGLAGYEVAITVLSASH